MYVAGVLLRATNLLPTVFYDHDTAGFLKSSRLLYAYGYSAWRLVLGILKHPADSTYREFESWSGSPLFDVGL